jgi:acyl-CoA thioesterase FadM
VSQYTPRMADQLLRSTTSLCSRFFRRVSDGQLRVRAKTHWAYVSTTTGRPVRIPPEVRQGFTIEPL